MKCSICGAEWTPPKGNNSFNSVCPFCGANLTEKVPDSLDDVLSVIVLNHGLDALKNERIALGLFADYAPKLRREHSLLKQFYNCEGSVVLFQALSSNAAESELLKNKVVARMRENWIADDAALLVCNSFLRAIGLRILEHPASDTHPEESLAENDVRISSADVREYYCKIRDLINVTWQIYQKKKRQSVQPSRQYQVGDSNQSGSVTCGQRGESPFITCPSCGRRCDTAVRVCSHCGFNTENIGKAERLCELAGQDLDGLDFQTAAARLEDADRLWPNNKKVLSLQRRLSEDKQRVGDRFAKLREANNARRYKEAERLYGELKALFPKYRNQTLEQKISAAIIEAEALLIRANNSGTESEALNLCDRAAALCVDLPEIQEIRKKYPPASPERFSGEPDTNARGNFLSWVARSNGRPVRCVVVRSHEGRVQNFADGEEIFRGNASSYLDREIEPGVPYWYNVFAERDGVLSQGATGGCQKVVNLFEVGPVSVVPGNRSLKLSWGTLPRNATVELYLSDAKAERHIASTREDSYLITNLANDVERRFRVALSYTYGERSMETAGIVISAAPICPPSQVSSLRLQSAQQGMCEAIWRHAGQGEVCIFASAQRPKWHPGDEVPLSVLERSMTMLQAQPLSPDGAKKLRQGEQGASFRNPDQEALYVTAAAVKSGASVFGPLVRAGGAASVTIQDIRAVNGRIHIFIDAPRDVSGLSVSYRFDQFPAGPSDPEAVKQHFTKKQYEKYRAIILGAPEERTYYFAVYAWFDWNGEREWSPGVEQVFDCSPKVIIDYSISSVHGPFGRGSVILEFQANVKRFTLPDIDVMSAVRTIPLFRDSASLLYTIPSQNVDGSLRIKIPLPKGTPNDTYIKPFLRDEATETRSCLRLKVRSSHKIT